MGMVGGGPGAFIGDVHRRAALLDGGVELVAGAFSSSLRKSRSKGRELLLDPARVHGSLEALIAHELALPAGERVDFVSIVTPNHLHFEMARALLPSGHPEGFIEAFANVYANACDTIRARLLGEEPDPLALDYPTVEDGLRGMLFIEAVVRSARSAEKWTRLRRA